MAEPFVAEIRIFPFNFAPRGWAFCDGQLLPISQNTALFSLVGTTYGGDGRTNFALPNLQGRVPMQQGRGPGLSNHNLGEIGGSESVTLLASQMPLHTHALRADVLDIADTNILGSGASLALSSGGALYQDASNGNMAGNALTSVGGNAPHNNLQPYLTLNFCIALQGVYPPRS